MWWFHEIFSVRVNFSVFHTAQCKIFVVCRHWYFHCLSKLSNTDVTNFQLLKKDELRWFPWPEITLDQVDYSSELTSSNFIQLWTHVIFETWNLLLNTAFFQSLFVLKKSRSTDAFNQSNRFICSFTHSVAKLEKKSNILIKWNIDIKLLQFV